MTTNGIVIFQLEEFKAQLLLLWLRETEIRKHVPEPYWTISGEFEKNGHIITARYYQQKISALSKATSIINECIEQKGRITKIENQKVTLSPRSFQPVPDSICFLINFD